jgi:peptidoglycan/LPS O-acetylase OafA/YrhL
VNSQPSFPPRYQSLDAWRGVASFGILLHHLFHQRLAITASLFLCVQLFFVISGYCMAAAAHRALDRGMKPSTFIKRRARRIAPPYLASVVFALMCFAIRGFNLYGWEGVRQNLDYRAIVYLQNFSMTQWLSHTHRFFAAGTVVPPWQAAVYIQGVYWSLNYEEQFYLVVGAAVALAAWVRPAHLLAALTAAVLLLSVRVQPLLTGLFVDYWLQFAAGLWVYVRLCVLEDPRARLASDLLTTVALLGVYRYARGIGELRFDPNQLQAWGQLTVCIVFACVLMLLRPLDGFLVRSPVGRLLTPLGTISYSLYLVHTPTLVVMNEAYPHLVRAFTPQGADVVVIAIVLGVAYGFYRLFERPFLNSVVDARAATRAA